MKDTVFVSNLCIFGAHGVFPEETKLGQKFFVDIECRMDFHDCIATDDFIAAVDYGELCAIAEQVSEAGPYHLIETFAARIADAILARFEEVEQARVRVRKPAAPLAAVLDHVGVEAVRDRVLPVAFSLGSNMGDKPANIRRAIARLATETGLEIDKVSSFWRTEPWGKEDQDWFVNACATGRTTLDPLTLLDRIKRIEIEIGREPGERWGPRLIDIDLLYAGGLRMERERLTLPHREMFNRAFVLVPLSEVAGEVEIDGLTILGAAEEVPGRDGVIPFDSRD